MSLIEHLRGCRCCPAWETAVRDVYRSIAIDVQLVVPDAYHAADIAVLMTHGALFVGVRADWERWTA